MHSFARLVSRLCRSQVDNLASKSTSKFVTKDYKEDTLKNIVINNTPSTHKTSKISLFLRFQYTNFLNPGFNITSSISSLSLSKQRAFKKRILVQVFRVKC